MFISCWYSALPLVLNDHCSLIQCFASIFVSAEIVMCLLSQVIWPAISLPARIRPGDRRRKMRTSRVQTIGNSWNTIEIWHVYEIIYVERSLMVFQIGLVNLYSLGDGFQLYHFSWTSCSNVSGSTWMACPYTWKASIGIPLPKGVFIRMVREPRGPPDNNRSGGNVAPSYPETLQSVNQREVVLAALSGQTLGFNTVFKSGSWFRCVSFPRTYLWTG